MNRKTIRNLAAALLAALSLTLALPSCTNGSSEAATSAPDPAAYAAACTAVRNEYESRLAKIEKDHKTFQENHRFLEKTYEDAISSGKQTPEQNAADWEALNKLYSEDADEKFEYIHKKKEAENWYNQAIAQLNRQYGY